MSKEKKVNFKQKAQIFAESYLSAVKKYAFFLESSEEEPEEKDEDSEERGESSTKDAEYKKREKLFNLKPKDREKSRRQLDTKNKPSSDEKPPARKKTQEEKQKDFKRKSHKEEVDAADTSKKYSGVENPKFTNLESDKDSNSEVDVEAIEQEISDTKKQILATRDGQKQYALRRQRDRLEDKLIKAQQKKAKGPKQPEFEGIPDLEKSTKVTPKYTRGVVQDKVDSPAYQRVVSAHPETKAKDLEMKKDYLDKEPINPEEDLAEPRKIQRPLGPDGTRGADLKTSKLEDSRKKEVYDWIVKNMTRDQVKQNPQAAITKARAAIERDKEQRLRIRDEIGEDDSPEAIARRAFSQKPQDDDEGAGRSWSTNPETVKSKVMRQFSSDKVNQLGTSMGEKAQNKILQFFLQVGNEYKKAKQTLVATGQDPMNPVSAPDAPTPNMVRLFDIAENIFKLPPWNPEDPKSTEIFNHAWNNARNNIEKIIPPQFLQSTLESYPFGDDKNPQIGARIESKLDDKFDGSARKQKIVDLLSNLSIQEFVKLIQYYKDNPREIDRSERALRQAQITVGAGGEKGNTTGSIRADKSGIETAEDFHGADAEDIPDADLEERDIENEPEETSSADRESAEDSIDKGSRNWFDDLHGMVSKNDLKDIDNSSHSKDRLMKILQAKHAFDNIFSDINDLETTSKLKGNLPERERTDKASRFLQALFGDAEGNESLGDVNLQKVAMDGLARHYAIFQIGKMVEHEAEKLTSINDPIKRSKLGQRLKNTAMSTFKQLSTDRVTKNKIRDVLINMMTKNKSGRLTLSDPRYQKLSGDQADIAKVIYRVLSPESLGGKQGATYGFDDFILDKASEVEERIIAIIDSKIRGEHEIRKNRERGRSAEREKSRSVDPNVELELAHAARRPRKLDHILNTGPSAEKDAIRGKGFRPGSGDRPPIMGVKPEFAIPPRLVGNRTPDKEEKPKGPRVKYAPPNPNIKRPPGVGKRPSSVNKESFMNKISSFFISEGFAMNAKNMKSYLIALYKTGSINRNFLEEMLVDLSDIEQPKEGKSWETVEKKKAKKLRG